MNGGGAALQARNLTKRFGSFTAVNDLSIALETGTITGFLGPNGAGKSTTLRMAVGLTRPTEGTVELFGRQAADPAARLALGYLPADPAFDRRLSARANLDLLAGLRSPFGDGDRERVADALGFGGAQMGQRVGELSSGMRQKLGLIAAMQHRPRLIILDEPANRLDPLVHRDFCDLIRELAQQGCCVLLSSHVLAEVESVCDKVVLIRSGKLIELTDIDSIRSSADRRVTVHYRGAHQPPPELTDASVSGNVVTGRLPARRPDLVRLLLEDPEVIDIEVAPASLEDIFLARYGEDHGAHTHQG